MNVAAGPPEPRRAKPRILFVAEAVTLAHVARPAVLARALDPSRYEVVFATDPRYNRLFPDPHFPVRAIRTIPSARFLEALAKGNPLYDAATLRAYVEEDLTLLRELNPDAVVGDFRLSLSVSARLTGTPYLTISNAYWSPYARVTYPLPELPVTRAVGVPVARVLFRLVRPLAFAIHSRPLNRVRREHGLPDLGFDLRRVYTDADHVLYADVPELTPTHDLPANHHFLGPIPWSPAVALPPWWDDVPTDRPAVYLTLGSSGRPELLPAVLAALAELPVSVLAATAGHPLPTRPPPNAWVGDYLPGDRAVARSDLVICNGGSLTTQQALAAGRPVIGVCGNMDQHLNMTAVERAGAGILLRSDQFRPKALCRAVIGILESRAVSGAAQGLRDTLARYPAGARFQSVLGNVPGTGI
jgi:UDP:flavonoid glycosyltransferase YjiC (YdhE family)